MRISARDEPIKSHGCSEGVHIGRAIRRISAQKFDDVGWARSAFVLVLLRRYDPERLTNIFLMHPDDVVSRALSIVALDDDGDFVFEPHDLRLSNWQAEVAGEHEADVLILRMAVEMARRRF